jgi:hypothetical protein
MFCGAEGIRGGRMTTEQQRAVMLQGLTRSDVEGFEFIAETPAGGMAYYSNEPDIAAIAYNDYIRIYYGRKIKEGKTASCFNESIINKTT